MRGLMWFKKDLRITDNPALHHAANECTQLMATYVIDKKMWRDNNISQRQIDFILAGVTQLQIELKKLNIPLIVTSSTAQVPQELLQITNKYQISKLYFNREYEFNEQKRDAKVQALFEKNKIKVETFDDQFILNPQLSLKKDGTYFQVFTPFKRYWLTQFAEHGSTHLLNKPKVKEPFKDLQIHTNKVDANLQAGYAFAHKKLRAFVTDKIADYQKMRDFPAIAGTSQLSPYLATGMISPRECFLAALNANHNKLTSGKTGALTWMSELIWREFYKQIIKCLPRLCMYKPFKLETDKLNWIYDKNLLQAWQEGRTGYPIVDAAMRQLNSTGWMHNRLRMISAMFLSKNLFLDWRLGEKYFSEQLIDIDLAANNGGWQWCASTGTDAVPYFRLFNPTTQSKRFDPEGEFIRKFVPELNAFPTKGIHAPYQFDANLAKQCDYPTPVIDFAFSRERILKAFKKLK